MTIEIPDEAVEAMRIPAAQVETELKKELALALYARSALSLGKAVEMAGVTRAAFEQLLCSRHVERPYSEEDLADDLKFARGFSKEK